MGSVYEEITRLETAKADIETAIEGCGVNVPDTDLISTYALYIRQIPSAVFSELNVDSVGGEDKYIKSIKQTNGLIEATTGGLVSSTSSGLAPKIGTSASSTISALANEWVLTSTKGGSPTWRKLPSNAFKNDNTTYSLSGALSGNNYITTLTDSNSNKTTATVPVMTGASSSTAGKAGLVPAPGTANAGQYLKGDGTWGTPANTTYSVFTGATSSADGTQGLVPKPTAGNQGKFLKADGTWAIPTNTTYSVVSSSANGLAPKVINTNTATVGSAYYVLASSNGSNTPSWYKLPANAFKNDNTTYTFVSGNGGFTVTPSGGTAQVVSIGKVDWANITNKPDTFSPSAHTHATDNITKLTSYTKATSASDLATTDTLNTALGKLEYKADYAYDWVIGVTATDTDEYINKWGEIVGFLDSVKEGTDILDEFVTRKTTQTITGAKTFSGGITLNCGLNINSTNPITWNDGTYHQRIQTTDDSTTNTAVFTFQQSSNTGSSWTDLFTIKDNGHVVANKFITSGGTSSQFVKGDGSLDSNTYLTSLPSHNHSYLKGWTDTRSVATTPNDYNGIFKVVGIKSAGTTLGLTTTQAGSYATLIGWRGWSDSSGGYSWEIASTDKNRLYVRSGSTTEWNNGWQSIAYISDIPTSLKNPNALTLQAGTFSAKTYDGSAAVTVNIPTHTSHLTNNSGFLTSHQSLANYVTLNTALTITGSKTFTASTNTFSGTSASILTVDRNSTNPAWIRFCKNGTLQGYIGITNDFQPVFLSGEAGSSSKILLHAGNYTSYVNTTNFPGLNSVGDITGVTAGEGLSGGGTAGSVTLTNAGVRATTINGNYLRVNTNGTNADLTIPYATTASLLNNTSVSDPSTAASGQNVKWYSQISQLSGYAGTNYGFPVSNNANGILWLGTHSGPYGWQMGFSSNGRIYARYISNNSFSTAANGGSWSRIAWTSDIPTVTNYYWANIQVSSSSSTETTPTFKTATVTTSVTTPLVNSTSRLTLNATNTGLYLKFGNDNTKSVILNGTAFKPFDDATEKLSLGTSNARWNALYSGKGNFTGDLTLYAASGDSPHLVFQRGNLYDGTYDWDQYVTGGTFKIRYNPSLSSAATWTDVLSMYPSMITTPWGITASGFTKTGSSNSYVLLGGGGHKTISDFMLKSDELTNNLTTITKTLVVSKDWVDTGIVFNKDTFRDGTGSYIVQLSRDDVYYWTGCLSIVISNNVTGVDSDEIILHGGGFDMSEQYYLRTKHDTTNKVVKLQIARSNTYSTSKTFTFKFKKLI